MKGQANHETQMKQTLGLSKTHPTIADLPAWEPHCKN